MLRRFFVLVLAGLILHATCFADEAEKASPAEKEAMWITSISQFGEDFVAGKATGLLLRPGAVLKFSRDDVQEGKFEQLYEHPAAVWCLGTTSDGEQIASVDYKGNLGVFKRSEAKATLHENAFERWCQSLVISPDDQSVVAGNEAGKIFVWNLGDSKVSKSAEVSKASITCIAFSPSGDRIAASDGEGIVHLLAWPSLESKGTIKIGEETAWCVAFQDAETLIVGSGDRKLYKCQASDQAEANAIASGSDWITRLAVSPNGQIAAAEVGGKIHFASGGSVTTIGSESGVWALCFNGESELLVGTRKDGVVVAGQSWGWDSP